jgi:hypothetical protein
VYEAQVAGGHAPGTRLHEQTPVTGQ